ncbi:hypothetical protein CMT37_18550, partial [Elizabethkingia anophelis]|nr:hypothetical protein [Elizabethkingia anophelis]
KINITSKTQKFMNIKKHYTPPKIEITYIEMEGSVGGAKNEETKGTSVYGDSASKSRKKRMSASQSHFYTPAMSYR